jgi:hypothetical protein
MIRESASQLPSKRLQIIRDSTKSIIDDSKHYMREFGVEMTRRNEPIRIDGRVLEAPELGYARNKTLTPRDGKWDLKINNCSFYEAANLQFWIIICFNQNAVKLLPALEREIRTGGQRFGMTIADAKKQVVIKPQADTIRNAFKRAKQVCDNRLQLIVFVIDPKISYLYELIKRIGDCEHSVITQCIKESNCKDIKYELIFHLII